jgi:hypothetical protein
MEILINYNSTFSAGSIVSFKGKNLQELCGFRGPNGVGQVGNLRAIGNRAICVAYDRVETMSTSVREQLPGVWDITHWSFRDDATGATSLQWNGTYKGRFMFDAQGRVSLHMMRTDRPGNRPSAGPNWAAELTPAEMLAILDGYLAYWGTYEVDEVARLITIHIDGCLRPGWLGVDQHRHYELTANPGEIVLVYNVPGAVHRLTWKKQ